MFLTGERSWQLHSNGYEALRDEAVVGKAWVFTGTAAVRSAKPRM